MDTTKGNAPRQRGAVNTYQGTANATIAKNRKKSNSNGCCGLADCIVALNLHELEIDRLLDAIVIVEREEVRWDDPRIAIRRAVQHLERIGLATPALMAGVKL